jgi:hypothetical protein
MTSSLLTFSNYWNKMPSIVKDLIDETKLDTVMCMSVIIDYIWIGNQIY